ncbi:MAG TPA: hypothetical protein PLV68_13495 [Ilumatobacteraceae bacterium]|nr:hypothetical protein [Ilumatobacteraceae bacterium]
MASPPQRHTDLLTAVIMEDPPLFRPDPGQAPSLEGNALLDGFRLMRTSMPQLQASGMSLEMLTTVLSNAPDTTRTGTFGQMLHRDGIETMAAGLLRVDASVLDPVLDGSLVFTVDPDQPFGVPALLVPADPTKPDAVASPKATAWFAANSPGTEVVVATGAGHLIHDEVHSRDTFRDTVLSFLSRIAP